MIFRPPTLHERELTVIAEIDAVRNDLRHQVAEPHRWSGSLRRLSLARAVQGSSTIEGYDATLDDVDAVLAGEDPLDADEETRRALAGYRDAMTYVLQLARDPHFQLDDTLIRSLHFMMTSYDLSKNPGRWRPGWVGVRNELTGDLVYEGPAHDLIPELITELVHDVNREADAPALVRAAMAHLNLTMIHPFTDGNGRMARCLQTLVLAREAILEPEFASIEEYLGRNTEAYYEVLADVGKGSWSPDNDARPWLRFCLTAHLRQARTLVWRVRLSEELWRECAREASAAGLPERTIPLLFNVALGFRARNATYRKTAGEEISETTASRDLAAAAAAGLLAPHGERRGRTYTASDVLRSIAGKIRSQRPASDDRDPFS